MHRIARVSPRGIPHFQTQLRCRCGPQQPDHAAVFTSRMHHNACTRAGRPTTAEREGSNTSASSQVRRTAARSAPYAPRPDGKARVFRKHNALPYCITLTKHILDVFQINRMQFCAVACSNIRRTGGGRAHAENTSSIRGCLCRITKMGVNIRSQFQYYQAAQSQFFFDSQVSLA